MCGLVAIVRAAGLRDGEDGPVLHRMRDAISHRGPDDATSEVVDHFAALGHRRLSIIDIGGSVQPLHDETGRLSCVFNGEIYNFVELRSELRARGHVFSTDGDGETIVHGYQEWGDDVASHLEGMFAFVLVDRDRRRVVVSRDRFGIKPLFWTRAGGAVLVASELKGILAHPAVSRVASALALELGSIRMNVPWPLTAFAGVERLPPGATLSIERDGRTVVRRFAPIVEVTEPDTQHGDVVGAAERALEAAVRRQMVADVPVGAFLSGGIDSTLIVTLMRRIAGGPIHTFSISVERDDESQIAEQTARRLGTIHHTIRLEQLDFEDVEALPRLYDEPFAETSAIGVRALSAAARSEVKVALSGDGGDEIFGGYETYRYVDLSARVGRALPRIVRETVSNQAIEWLARSRWPNSVRRALRAAALVGAAPMPAHRGLCSQAWARGAASQATTEALSQRIVEGAARLSGDASPLRLAMASDRLERLPNAMLTKVDIASMSASLEVRVPMLDDVLVRFADRLPKEHLVGPQGVGKVLLRRVLERILPGGPAWQPKRGFALPIDLWMRKPRMAARLSDHLRSHGTTLRRLTATDVVAELCAFEAGRTRYSAGTAAMRLLWFSTVASWSDQFGVTETDEGMAPIATVA